MNKSKLELIFSQPHQPFFAFGVVNAIIFMLIFLLSYKGVVTLTISPNLFHSFSLIFAVFTSFFLGFLLTTFPRFSQTMALEKSIYTTNFALLFFGVLLFLVGSVISSFLIYLGVFFVFASLVYTIVVFYQIYKASKLPELYDQKWIMIGFASGIVSSFLFFVGFLSNSDTILSLAKFIGIYLFLTITALSVGQRMIPFFSHVMVEKNQKLLLVTFSLLSAFIIFEVLDLKIGFIFLLLLSLYLSREIYSWKLPYKNSQSILWILHLGLFWLPVSLFISSFASFIELIFEKDFIYVGLHLVMLGFLTTLMIGFGTRVTLGHSGNQMVIDKTTKALFYLTPVVVITRAIYSFSGFNILFDLSVLLWLVLFIIWTVKYLPVVLFGKKIT